MSYIKFLWCNVLAVMLIVFSITHGISQSSNTDMDALQATYDVNPTFMPYLSKNNYTDNPPLTNAGQSNDGSIVIQNFNAITGIKVGTPHSLSADPTDNMNHQNMVDGDPLLQNGNGQLEYVVKFAHQHDFIPNFDENEEENEYFKFSFELTNNTSNSTLYYVIFYQNESYKYPELGSTLFHSGSNFYGSWGFDESFNPGLRPITHVAQGNTEDVVGYFRIRGNPRNELKYQSQPLKWTDDPNENNDSGIMGRWRKVPRVGEYKFLIVVTADPDYFSNNHRPYLVNSSDQYRNSHYVSPFQWRNLTNSAWTANTAVAESNDVLKIKVHQDVNDLGQNILSGEDINTHPRLAWEVSIDDHQVINDLKKIPLHRNVDEYTQLDYNWAAHFFHQDELKDVILGTGANSGDNVTNSVSEGGLLMEVPAVDDCEKEPIELEKTAIKYRPLLYGKYTIKAQIPKLYNEHDIHRGLGYAFWIPPTNTSGYDQQYCQAVRSDFDFNLEVGVANEGDKHYPNDDLFPDEGTSAYNEKRQNIDAWDTHHYPGIMPYEADQLWFSFTMGGGKRECLNIVEQPIGFDQSLLLSYPYSEGNKGPFLIRRMEERPGPVRQAPLLINTSIVHDDDINIELDDDDGYFSDDPGYEYYYQIEWTPYEVIYRMGPSLTDLTVWAWYPCKHMAISNVYGSFSVDLKYFNSKAEAYYRHAAQFIPIPSNSIYARVKEVIIE